MSDFNLGEWLIQEAMGSQRMENRDAYYWWDYEELKSEPDEDWATWSEAEPGLNDVLKDAEAFRGGVFRKLRLEYGMTNSEILLVFKTYIGFQPSLGAYICSIGPYIGKKFEDSKNKFGFYLHKKRKSTREDVLGVVTLNIQKYAEAYGIEMDASDFRFVVVSPKDYDDSRLKQEDKNIVETISNLTENSREFADFSNRQPIIGEGSRAEPNARGLNKVMAVLSENGNWGTLVEEAMADQAASRGLSDRQLSTLANNDVGFVRDLHNAIRKKYREKLSTGEAAALGMSAPPDFTGLNLSVTSGQQIFSTIPRNGLMSKQLGIRAEVAGVMAENPQADIEELTSIMNRNPKRRRKGSKIPEEEVVKVLAEIAGIKAEKGEDGPEFYAALKDETLELAVQYKEKKGFDDLQTTYDMAKLYFTNLPIDPATRMKLGMESATWSFTAPENFSNVTDADLASLRGAHVARTENEVATPEEVEREIGSPLPLPEEVEEPVVEDPESVEETTAPVPQPDVAPEKTPEEEEEDNEREMLDLFGNTFRNLIKIAAELDEDGKYIEAEEVHKVIRKYEKRIKS